MPPDYQQVIHKFIEERLQPKLEPIDKKLDKEADPEKLSKLHEQRQAVLDKYKPEVWLESAASRVSQIKLTTHAIKMTHPEAKCSSFFLPANTPNNDELLTTATLGTNRAEDVVGNAAALDVYKFLQLTVDGKQLLQHAQDQAQGFVDALSGDTSIGVKRREQFASISSNDGTPTSHQYAKQLYWPIDNATYHLLSPLASSSLSHATFKNINHWRFSDDAKALRDARREKKYTDESLLEFPNLVRQGLGGTKPQNISQLNSERGGTNYLLPSYPPNWNSKPVQQPLNTSTVFGRAVLSKKEVYWSVKALADYLKSVQDAKSTQRIKEKRQRLTDAVIDEVLTYASLLAAEPAGWSDESQLVECERYWLDPRNPDTAIQAKVCSGGWESDVRHRFSTWLNAELRRQKLKMDDSSHEQWADDLGDALKWFEEEVNTHAE